MQVRNFNLKNNLKVTAISNAAVELGFQNSRYQQRERYERLEQYREGRERLGIQ